MDRRATLRRPGGYIRVSGPDGTREYDTRRCCHCGGHFAVVPGSGTRRGWCMSCGDVTCGAQACDACEPFESKLRRMESGT